MATCQKCGAYFSEKSCPFCTPDDSPLSPVTTIEKEEAKAVRIIDPLELIESIEDQEIKIKRLQEENDLEIQKLTENVTAQEEIEGNLKRELDEINSQVSEIEVTLKNKQEEKQNLIQENENIEQEIERQKSELLKIEENISTKETEVAKLKEELGAI